MKSKSYSAAGVDIDRGDRFVDFIRNFRSPAVAKTIGGFSGGFEIDASQYPHPVFMTTTDGVGTKLIVAQKLSRFDTVGIDLVAMCINDLLVCGATPLVFLDYIACGAIRENVLQEVMRGIVRGCEEAACTLSGGETAEMPEMYAKDDFDLAGFAVGVANRDSVLPQTARIHHGDVIMALPSVGIHSNGLSLARKAIPESERSLWDELLRPTKIYTREMRLLVGTGKIRAAAHITGGGLEANLARVLPEGLVPHFSRDWPVPPIFPTIQRFGAIDDGEMNRVFNMGIGVALVVSSQDREGLLATSQAAGIELLTIGELVRG